ncbi:tyrosine-protein phosphatase [Sphingomonas sp. ID0503]|uniref:tyrosine-protein phosphatase n=1 Tax=Sphingomonas sp. ID0503 TaxID=3399691 RepID=UPI003AFAF0D1
MKTALTFALIATLTAPAWAKVPADPLVTRIAPDRVKVSWSDPDGVDVYLAERPDAPADASRRVSADDRDGVHEMAVAPGTRPYFLLVDHKDHASVRVAERLLPLEQGSNFRDIGGYAAAGGKHVRWGMIYRAGATPMLTMTDQQAVANLHLANLVDLRSSEERQIAPTRIEGVPYHAVGYSINAILAAMKPPAGQTAPVNGSTLYRALPDMLAPQMRVLFDRLLAREGPVAYNCSAGQDRTGFATAMILTVLGVPRDTIIADYHLSTAVRHPEYEMPVIEPGAFPGNPAAKLYAGVRAHPGAPNQPLKEGDGTAFLAAAFDQVEKDYGSVEGYLNKAAGVTAADIALLRKTYLE